ncbi:unnamed protein product [Effrenium voratum]|nr:unnamed protein product [Effrenium voratum]
MAPSVDERVKVARARRRDAKTQSYTWWIAGTATTVLFACAAVIVSPDGGPFETPVNDASFIAHLQHNARWQAGEVPFFKGWTIGDVQRLSGIRVSNQGGIPECSLPEVDVPESFDARQRWPRCFPPVFEMGNCSASWALAAAASVSHRLCISNRPSRLSAQQLLSCEREFGQGCDGGSLDTVWKYMKQSGLVTEHCFPYQAADDVPCATCGTEEPNRVASVCKVSTAGSIRREIFLNGPVLAPVMLMNDFLLYRGGIYQETRTASQLVTPDRQRQLHAVTLLGWGIDGEQEYWIIENSFGQGWGEDGYAKVKRDGVLLEEFVFAGTPANPKVLNFGGR